MTFRFFDAAMTEIKTGTCHCGAVEFQVSLEAGLENLRRCNCSLCRRKGAIMAAVPLESLRVTRRADNLGLYQWNRKVAKHYFCKTRGTYTHHAKRSNPNACGFNAGCIDEVERFALGEVAVGDGGAMSLVSDNDSA